MQKKAIQKPDWFSVLLGTMAGILSWCSAALIITWVITKGSNNLNLTIITMIAQLCSGLISSLVGGLKGRGRGPINHIIATSGLVLFEASIGIVVFGGLSLTFLLGIILSAIGCLMGVIIYKKPKNYKNHHRKRNYNS